MCMTKSLRGADSTGRPTWILAFPVHSLDAKEILVIPQSVAPLRLEYPALSVQEHYIGSRDPPLALRQNER